MRAQQLRTLLQAAPIKELVLKRMRPAAILVPLRILNNELYVLLTRRTDLLPHHAGEISFPGGSVEALDVDDWATATRETQEKIGVPPQQVTYLGRLNDCYSIHDYRVSCHVGLLAADSKFVPQPDEIEALIELPLARLADPAIYHREDWQHKGRSLPVDFYTLDGQVIWGMTGAVLKELLEKLKPLLKI